MLRNGLLILSGTALGALLSLLRNLLLAHLVSVEDFGIATTFAIAVSVAEMLSAFGLPQRIAQHPDGDRPGFQAALQGFQLLRAIVAAVLLFALAGPIAAFFGLGYLTPAYQLLAVIPLASGFLHFDIYRLQRQAIYLPGLLASTGAVLLSLLAVLPAQILFGDFRVMLCAVITQGLAQVALSHLLARRRYALRFRAAVICDALRFGWPILLNGALLFAVFNGERLMVGRLLGMADLAVFSLAFSLCLTPTLVLERSAQNLFLPRLAACRGDARRFLRLAWLTGGAHLLGALALAGAVLLIGGPLITLLLGPRYGAALPLLPWLAVLQGVRLAKGGSSTIALALGHSGNGLVASLARVALLPLAWIALRQGAALTTILGIGIVGECAGFILALGLMARQVARALGPSRPN